MVRLKWLRRRRVAKTGIRKPSRPHSSGLLLRGGMQIRQDLHAVRPIDRKGQYPLYPASSRPGKLQTVFMVTSVAACHRSRGDEKGRRPTSARATRRGAAPHPQRCRAVRGSYSTGALYWGPLCTLMNPHNNGDLRLNGSPYKSTLNAGNLL